MNCVEWARYSAHTQKIKRNTQVPTSQEHKMERNTQVPTSQEQKIKCNAQVPTSQGQKNVDKDSEADP